MSTYISSIPHTLQFQHPGQEVLLVRISCERLTRPSDTQEKIIDLFPTREAAVAWLHERYGIPAVHRILHVRRWWRGAVDEDYRCVRHAYGIPVEDTYTVFNV